MKAFSAKQSAQRLAAVSGAAIGAALLFATPAMAGSDTDAVRTAAARPDSINSIGSFFVSQDQRANGLTNPAENPAAITAKHPTVGRDVIALNTLNPAFVAGTSTTATVPNGYAVTATSATGQQAIAVIRNIDGTWLVDEVREGTDEAGYAKAANGNVFFREPQINAWYTISGNQVLPLNNAARTAIGDTTSLTAYQQRVHDRYADKQAGSDYQNAGKYGGYGTEAAPATPHNPTTPWTTAAAITGLVILGAGTYALRRRHTHS